MIYFALILLLFLLSFLNQIDLEKRFILILEFFVFALFLLFGGLRYKVGADWDSYEVLFNGVSSIEEVVKSREEKLYMMSNFLIKIIFDNYSFFVFVFFLIAFVLKFNVIKLYSKDVFLSLMIYVYGVLLIYDFNGIRQGMAMSFIMLSIPFILNKSFVRFSLLIIIACFFHISAIVFLPFYFLSRMEISNSKLLFIIILSILVATPLRLIIQNSLFYQLFMASETFSHYSTYTDGNSYQINTPILSIALFQRLIIFCLFIASYDSMKIDSYLKLLLRNAYFLSIVIFLLLSFSDQFAARISFNYKLVEILMVPAILSAVSNKYLRILLLIFFLILSMVGTDRLISVPDGYLLPYRNLLFM